MRVKMLSSCVRLLKIVNNCGTPDSQYVLVVYGDDLYSIAMDASRARVVIVEGLFNTLHDPILYPPL